MLPLAAVLALAGVGQSLVIQQRGMDLSGAGVIALTAVILSQQTQGLVPALLLSLIIAILVGLINGSLVRFGLISIVMTLATYQVLTGVVYEWSNGVAGSVPASLSAFVNRSVLGIPVSVLIVGVVVGLGTIVLRLTSVGRRFVESGINRTASISRGSRADFHAVVAYVTCSVCYWLAGVLLAGYLSSPSLNVGNEYLLASIAVVVLGGNSFGSAKISLVATALGALFLTQLTQFTLSLGAPKSSQLFVQGAGIVALPLIQYLLSLVRQRRARTSRSTPAESQHIDLRVKEGASL
nr:ABC transporter permease [Rhodococcus sp. 14C212]